MILTFTSQINKITLDDITLATRLSDAIKRSLHLFVFYQLKRYFYIGKSFEKKTQSFGIPEKNIRVASCTLL